MPRGAQRDLQESAAIGISPRYVALATFWQGEIAFGKGRYDTAAQLYERFLSRAPRTEREYALAYYNLGYCRFLRKQMPAAGEQFDRFLKLYPADDDYRADALNRRGDVHYATRRFEQALQCYTAAAASDRTPRYYAQYRRALMLGILGQPARKIEALRAIVAADRGDYAAEAAYELGRTHLGLEQYRESAAVLERFVGQYPHSPHRTSALSDLGLIYANLGDRKRSLEYYDRVVQTAPTSSEARGALEGIRELYVADGNAEGYFAYAERSGNGDLSARSRDSLSFAAARSLYLADRTEDAARSLRSYVKSFPQGPTSPTPSTTSAPATAPPGGASRAGDARTARRPGAEPVHPRDAGASLRGGLRPKALRHRRRGRQTAERVRPDRAGARRGAGALRPSAARRRRPGGDPCGGRRRGESQRGHPEALRRLRFARASILRERGQEKEALALYEQLRQEVRTAEGPKRCTASSSRSSARATTRRPRR